VIDGVVLGGPLPSGTYLDVLRCIAKSGDRCGVAEALRGGRDYLSLKLDDPSFNAPIYANLFADEDGEGYTLLWSRPRKTD
jgi:uncharacterized protein (DUF736 family)